MNRTRGSGRGSTVLDTGLLPVFSKKSSTPLFVPLTDALDTTHIYEGRVAMQLAGVTSEFKARAAYRMSDDGITWSSTVTSFGPYKDANGWSYAEDAASQFTTDQRLHIQFGVEVANDTLAQVEHALAQLQIELRETRGMTLGASNQKLWSDGSTTAIFHPLTEPIRIERIGGYRATIELVTHSGDVRIQPAYQVSNDGRTWYSGVTSAAADTFATFGLERTSNGITYATTFATFTPDEKKRFVRFGSATRNGTAGKPETGLVSMRLDARRT